MRNSGLAWVIGGALLGLVLAAGLLVLTRLLAGMRESPAPILTVLPLPSVTLTPPATPLGTAEPLPTHTPQASSGGPRNFAPGQLVSISGTGGEGLRLRESPGLDSAVRMVALESEVFEVVEGPVAADGYNWWRLTNPFNRVQEGWGVDQFLSELES